MEGNFNVCISAPLITAALKIRCSKNFRKFLEKLQNSYFFGFDLLKSFQKLDHY